MLNNRINGFPRICAQDKEPKWNAGADVEHLEEENYKIQNNNC